MRFADGTLRRFWKNGRAKGIDARSAEHLKELLDALNAATAPTDMAQPAWAFHRLSGDRKDQYAVEVRGLFRLVFEWEKGEAVRVRVEDYHGR
jgi:proteic killer suppression protein